ncbi:septum formation initiator family protein [Levilactobacillus brevis]|uniref:Septum formation initiator family protein n=1 Tax=Levilactobacillus brevis TaxID=1580 RepID=A0AB38X440_LEVBR|nr:septum formation initiator family protein [Levilactobacillus brevis]KLE29288.1 dihydroorotate dehydrogenase [Levilactobacillus brevis]MBY7146281.1 septum formation initiator family protein [Levilactobacillus brevis]MCP9615100.1 septum formation initiator family protein [Levilactobacillus brevis]WAD01443.1 septum formation initiator family protein [Levilactobacillus brevis]
MADEKVQPAKVKRLENDYTRQLDHQQAVQHHTRWLGRRRMRRALRIGLVFAVFALILGIQLVRTNASLHKVNQQVATSERQLTKTKAENTQLDLKVKQLNNQDYVAQLIRSKYYYSKSGETIYSLPGDHASDVTAK